MTRLSGALSAADLAQAVLLHLHGVTRGDLTADAFAAPPGLHPAELCTATGQIAAAACPLPHDRISSPCARRCRKTPADDSPCIYRSFRRRRKAISGATPKYRPR